MSDVKKPEVKPAEPKVESEMAKAVREGIAEGMAMAIALAQKTQAPAAPVTAASAGPGFDENCTVCGQKLRGCKGNHRKIAVYPKSRKHGKFFQGVRINGVTYLSNSAQHFINVPEESNIEYLISQWEQNEEELSTGREVEHNSGSIGAGGQFNPAGTNPGNSFR